MVAPVVKAAFLYVAGQGVAQLSRIAERSTCSTLSGRIRLFTKMRSALPLRSLAMHLTPVTPETVREIQLTLANYGQNFLSRNQSPTQRTILLGEADTLHEEIDSNDPDVEMVLKTEWKIDTKRSPLFREGACGQLKLVRALDSGEFRAMKVIDQESTPNEFEILKTVPKHPNVLPIHDICSTEGLEARASYHIFTPLAPLGDGQHFVEQWGAAKLTFEPQERENMLAFITLELVNGLNALHKADIAHLDLKPGNILFTQDARPVICDFGTSELSPYGESCNLFGTLPFTPPEQLDVFAHPYNPFFADLWSLGATLTEFNTGFPIMGDIAPIKERSSIDESRVAGLAEQLLQWDPDERLPLSDIQFKCQQRSDLDIAQGQALLRKFLEESR